jgi:cytochrome c553
MTTPRWRDPIRGLAVLALGLFTCRPTASVEAPQPRSPESVRFEHDMMVRFHMHENFDLLRAIEKLLVRGKLDEVRLLARGIAEAPDEPGMAAWAKQAALVRERAAALATAPDAAEACRREARLAIACAGCHVDAGAAPEFQSPGQAPPDLPTIEARMRRHLWATDRLWEGIVGAADDAWRQGLDVLAATPLSSVQDVDGGFARRLQQLADRARVQQATATATDRAHSYGEILTTCTGCHTARPKAP